MSRIVGIDIRRNLIQAALLRTSYRRVYLESLAEVDPREFESLREAIASVVRGFALHGDAVAVSIDGDAAFIHRLLLPPAALKQVEEVVPFELEAQIPVDFDTLVYDSRVLPRREGEPRIDVISAAAPIEVVRQRIADVAGALAHEPERIGVGPLPLANLASLATGLGEASHDAIVDLGDQSSELVIVHQGTAVYARTLSIGVSGLPAAAPELVRVLRQTLVSWNAANETPVQSIYLCGGGSLAQGISEYLGAELEVPVAPLPLLQFESVPQEYAAALPRFAKSVGLALSLRAGSKDLNLRQGELSYQRGFGFLKNKIPLLAGLGAVMLASFLFSAWAEVRALEREHVALSEALVVLSREILREETDDVDRVLDLLDVGTKAEKDPQPELDAFGLAVSLAENIPREFEHSIAELDLQRGHVKLSGVVNSTEQAQKVADALGRQRCFQNVKISKIAQEVKGTRQKYSMEFDVKCQDAAKKSTPTEAPEPEAEAEAEEE